MSFPLETDASRLAKLTRLGQEVVYTPFGGVAKNIFGIFDAEAQVEQIIGEQTVIGTKPVIECRTIDLTGTIRKGTILVDSTTYTIEEKHPDSTGMTILIMEKT